MSDLIDRQSAIDDVLDLHADHRVSWVDAVIDALEALPSAQPEIIRCKDCIYSHTDVYYGEECLTCENTDGLCCDVYKEDYCSMAERRTDG